MPIVFTQLKTLTHEPVVAALDIISIHQTNQIERHLILNQTHEHYPHLLNDPESLD